MKAVTYQGIKNMQVKNGTSSRDTPYTYII
ncbi:hypothetical protein ABID96_002659 [Bacillus sp. OAE603]